MKRRKRQGKRIFLRLACICSAVLLMGGIGVVMYVLPYSRSTMDLSLMQLQDSGTPAVLYSAESHENGDTVYRFMAEALPPLGARSIRVALEEMPEDLLHAFIAMEDKRFYSHKGVDIKRTLHAAWDYAVRRGEASFGGSTITQQVVKNLTGYAERTPERKLSEMFCAWDLEKQVSKEEILEVYLNIIHLGSGCSGVGAAAKEYFGKSVTELTLCECATLAAVTSNPAYYHPRNHPENNRKRREIVLSQMLSQGYISETEYQGAISEEPMICPKREMDVPMTSWYTEAVMADVLKDLQARRGMTKEAAERLLSSGGLLIETCMDVKLQAVLTSYYEALGHFPEGEDGRPQSAVIVIDPHSGEVLGLVGAIGEKTAYYPQNYATQTKRPAGSTIKPIGVYAPALKNGDITWGSVFEDEAQAEYNGRPWPSNADGIYRGRVTLREGIANSLNTVAVQVAEQIGVEAAFDFMKNTLHMQSLLPPERGNAGDVTLASVALGQQSVGVTLRELTAAYTVFLEGVYHAPITYRRVIDPKGNVLLENKTQGERVLSAEEAGIMTKLLESVTEDGTAKGLHLKKEGTAVAGKTGTTQDSCDKWFVGYTPRLLCGVWMGYDYPKPLASAWGNPCLYIWDDVMRELEICYERYLGQTEFSLPEGLVSVKLCPETGEIASPGCYLAAKEGRMPEVGWFVEGSEPRDTCRLHFDLEALPDGETGEETAESAPFEEGEPRIPNQISPWYQRKFEKIVP